jgi:hypothetical protein
VPAASRMAVIRHDMRARKSRSMKSKPRAGVSGCQATCCLGAIKSGHASFRVHVPRLWPCVRDARAKRRHAVMPGVQEREPREDALGYRHQVGYDACVGAESSEEAGSESRVGSGESPARVRAPSQRLVVRGAWCTVHGAWCMVHGAWCMVRGAWCMVHGAWCMVHGAWCMVHGAWCMVRGAWCTVHGAWCMVHGAWCMVHGAPVSPVRARHAIRRTLHGFELRMRRQIHLERRALPHSGARGRHRAAMEFDEPPHDR